MEKKYSLINNITGWSVLIFSSIIYILTIEASASFWDCGEFIASATKLQVGHPPGAPLWSMKARMFAVVADVFSDSPESIAYAINIFSALCSSFSILFLFWTITAFGKKIASKSGALTSGQTYAIMFSGVVGALAFTFSDSFWFSAVEAEVYAASSLYTAAVFWLALKWDANAHKAHSDRYLILIAYLMGLSIGVHILNLLVIPAIVYIYYFNKEKVTQKGFVIAGIVGVALLGIIQQVVISYSVEFATKFEYFFVNTLGMSFNSGMWFYFVLIAALLISGIIYSKKKNKPNIQKAFLGVMVILIGYSSFAMIVIRSAANPPMDENNPENIMSLLPYLNREQYGDRPLAYGQSFVVDPTDENNFSILDYQEPYKDGSPSYYQDEKTGKYKVSVDGENSKPNYDKKTCMYLPRMYSTQKHHVDAYKTWVDFEGEKQKVKVQDRYSRSLVTKTVSVPTTAENLKFFVNYQFNFMYWRYFMWNFVGRQNDIQGHGVAGGSDAVLKGNWLSGVDFVDNVHVGDQETLPASLKDNPGRNTFYFLPLILGIIGAVFHFSVHRKDAWIVTLLFLMTGVAIIIYLNQTPYQPRERDYAYAGSFYAFAIWIGLGVQALYHYMFGQRKTEEEVMQETGKKGIEAKLLSLGLYEIVLTAVGFIAVGVVASMIGSHESKIIGYSCLFIGLIIAAYVGVSAVVGKALNNHKAKAVLAFCLTGFVPVIMAVQGWDDHDRSDKYTAADFAKNYLDSCDKNAIIFTNGDNDTFPLWYVQEVEGYRTDVRVVNLSLLNTDWYIDQMVRKAYDGEAVPFSMTKDQYRQGTRDYVFVQNKWSDSFHDLKKVMDFVKSDSQNAKIRTTSGDYMNYLPTNKFSVAVDSAAVIENGIVSADKADLIPEKMDWKIGRGAVMKAKLMILDLMAHNNWKRPVYFAMTVGSDNYMNLEEYFQLEGLAFKVTPIKQKSSQGGTGHIDIDKMYENLVHNFQWGNMEKPGVYMGEQVQRMTSNYRNNFARLARELLLERKDTARAIETLDKCMEVMPPSKIPLNFFTFYIADAYYMAGEFEKANNITQAVVEKYRSELLWYIDQEDYIGNALGTEVKRSIQYLSNIQVYVSNNIKTADKNDPEVKRAQGLVDDIKSLIEENSDRFDNFLRRGSRGR